MQNLFENISDKNILKLKRILKASTMKYAKGINILSNVNQKNYITLIDEGSVQLVHNDYNGNKTILQELEKGDLYAFLTKESLSDDLACITKEDSQITYIEIDEITNDEIIKSDFYIIFIKNLIQLLNDQLTNKNARIELLTQRTTRDKILAYFKLESQKKGSRKFVLPMSYTELAAYLSVDRSAMTREIKFLKEEGFIKTNGKKIEIEY